MKKHITVISIMSLLLISCFGVIDTKNNKPVTNVDQADLTGTWKADKFSYEFSVRNLDSRTLKLEDTISLLLNRDGTFMFKNALEVSEDSIIQKDYIGTWELEKRIEQRFKEQFEIRLRTEKGFRGMPSRIPIYKKDNQYELFIFIGDPDSEERIGLKKDIPGSLEKAN